MFVCDFLDLFRLESTTFIRIMAKVILVSDVAAELFVIISSPELKAQVSFSAHFLSVYLVRWSVHMSVNFIQFIHNHFAYFKQTMNYALLGESILLT